MLFNSVTVAIFFIELISSFQQQIAAQVNCLKCFFNNINIYNIFDELRDL